MADTIGVRAKRHCDRSAEFDALGDTRRDRKRYERIVPHLGRERATVPVRLELARLRAMFPKPSPSPPSTFT